MITSIGRAFFQFSWAKSLSWFDRTKSAKIHSIFSIGIAEYTGDSSRMMALRIIIGPISVTAGWANPSREEQP